MGSGGALAASVRGEVMSRYRQGTVPAENGAAVGVFPHSLPPAEYERLVRVAQNERALRTIEVGLCLGFSALAFLEASSASPSSQAQHLAMDPFQSQVWGNAGLVAIRASGLLDRFEFFEEESQLLLPRLVAENREFDLAFVDGDHRFESAFLDLYFMSRLVRPEGLVIADDVGMPAVRLAVAYFQTNMGCQVLVPGDGSELWEPIDAASFLRSPARLAALRLPSRRERAAWDAFAPFGVEDVSGRDGLQAVRRAVLRRVAGVFKRGH